MVLVVRSTEPKHHAIGSSGVMAVDDERSDTWKQKEDGEGSSHDPEIEMGTRLVPPSRRWSADRPMQHISNVLGDALSSRR